MQSRFNAIATKYRGRTYRSQLEARWAAFFDMVRWPYEYEPFPCAGWIPDFSIHGATNLLVEVKPFVSMDEWRRSGAIAKAKNAVSQNFCSSRRVIFLGATIRPVEGIFLGATVIKGKLSWVMLVSTGRNIDLAVAGSDTSLIFGCGWLPLDESSTETIIEAWGAAGDIVMHRPVVDLSGICGGGK